MKVSESAAQSNDGMRGLDLLAKMNTGETFEDHAEAKAPPSSGQGANPGGGGGNALSNAKGNKAPPSRILGASFELAR